MCFVHSLIEQSKVIFVTFESAINPHHTENPENYSTNNIGAKHLNVFTVKCSMSF